MRIAILGAGAVGGFYGARLARAGHDVVFVARGATLDALRTRGIQVKSELGDLSTPVRAEDDPSTIGQVDLVIVAVKTYSNPQALPLVAPLVGPGTAVLTLQNGVDSARELAGVVDESHVLAGTTYIGVSLPEPGVVHHVGSVRRIVFGEAFGERTVTARVSRIHEVLAAADVQAETAADSRVPIWEKFIFLAPIAGLTAAARLPIGAAWAHQAFRYVYIQAMAEIEALARREGVAVADDVCEQKVHYLDKAPGTMRTSMMMDLMAGKPLELDALLGTVVRRGRAAGIQTPVTATLYGILKPFEHGAPSA
jgi:2-dehydropantoate 2-reductase